MKGVQRWPVNYSRLMSQQHSFAVIEAIDYDCSRVAQPNLKDRVFVLAPPFLSWRISSG